MEAHRLPVDAAMQASPVDQGWARSIRHGRRTVEQVLEAARAAMNEQDRAEEYARDPIAYIRAERARRSLWGRLTGGRTWK